MSETISIKATMMPAFLSAMLCVLMSMQSVLGVDYPLPATPIEHIKIGPYTSYIVDTVDTYAEQIVRGVWVPYLPIPAHRLPSPTPTLPPPPPQVSCTTCPFTVDGTTLSIEGDDDVLLHLATNRTAIRSVQVIPPAPPKAPPPAESIATFSHKNAPGVLNQFQCPWAVGQVCCVGHIVVISSKLTT